jgi:hypothetical protein
MKWLSLAITAAALIAASPARSEIFKCTSPQGQVSFAATPCADGSAETSLQRRGPPNMLRQGEPVDHAHKLNLKATQVLKVSGRAKFTVYEMESYKQHQRNRPPPPTAPSQCKPPLYESQCFDPSGGQSMKKAK